MTIYYIDDAGSATAPYDTWAKAATSLSQLDDAIAFASGDIIYIAHDHVDQYTHSANRTFTGSTTGKPVSLISVTQGSDPPTYQAGTSNQIDTTEGAYNINFTGGWALYGIKAHPGAIFFFGGSSSGTTGLVCASGCAIVLSNAGRVMPSATRSTIINTSVSINDSGNTPTPVISSRGVGNTLISGMTFTGGSTRTGQVIDQEANGNMTLLGCDFSSFTNATPCEIFYSGAEYIHHVVSFVDCKMPATWVAMPTSTANIYHSYADIKFINCGSGDQPTSLIARAVCGDIVSSSAIYRTSGGMQEGTPWAWLVTTTSSCCPGLTFDTPWIMGTIGSTGSKTFDVYITNDTADLTDAEAWLEVWIKGTSSSGLWTRIADSIATITTTPVAQADDTASTWNGTGPSFTYKQKLSVTGTVNTTGQYRARVCIAKSSIAGSAYCYIDPKVTVS